MSKTQNQRGDVKNPNNAAYQAAADNRSVQLNTPPKSDSGSKTPSPASNKK